MGWLASALREKKTPELTTEDFLGDQLSAVEAELRWHTEALVRHEEALVYHGKTIIWMEPAVKSHIEILEPKVANNTEAIQRFEPMLINHAESISRMESALQMQKAQLEALGSSRSYRIGRIITFFPRKFKAFLIRIKIRTKGKKE
jgi:hypothetical protein